MQNLELNLCNGLVMTNVSIKVQKEDAYLHPDLEFWM